MNKLFILFSAGCMVLSTQLTAQEEVDPYGLFVPFKESKTSWGYKKGSEVSIPARYEYVTAFSEGYALVKSKGKWGYIDTLGNWYIEPEYDKGQPFQNGIAFVKKNGKTGLIGYDKTIIIEPKYDNIREDYSAYYLINGDKMGMISRESPEYPVIPTIYDSIMYFSTDIASGKNSDGSWDIYFRGVKTVEKADQPVSYKNHRYSYDMAILSMNGKYGVYSLPTGWIVPPEYGVIEFLEFSDYRVKDQAASLIMALHDQDLAAIDPEYMYNENLKDSITLVKINGDAISNLKFNSITHTFDRYSEIPLPYVIEMSRGGKIYQLAPNFTLKSYNFSNPVSHYYNNYFIADGGDAKQYILDKNFNLIDSFYRVQKYREMVQDYENSGEMYDPETGEYTFEPNFIHKDVEEPFLEVYRKTGDKIEKAFYDLEARKVMSVWFDENQAVTVLRTGLGQGYGNYEENTKILYAYYPEMDFGNPENNRGKKMGYYISGMSKGTDLLYEIGNTVPVTGNYFVMRTGTAEKPVFNLFRFTGKDVELVSSEYEIEESINLYGYGTEYGYDPETGEGVWNEVSTRFNYNFLVLKKDKKFGMVCFNGDIFQPQYDTITQNTSADFVINTLVNEKYGTVDLVNGYEIKPQFDAEPYINSEIYSANKTIFNTVVYDGNGSYMLDLRGRKFYGNPQMTFPRRVKGKYGLFAYLQSDMYAEAMEQVKANYKYLEQSFIPGVFMAQGKGKKMGLINFIGDTLIPLKYDEIRPYDYNGDNTFLLEVTQKKKKGLYDLNLGEVVPARYTEINRMGDYDIMYNMYEVKIGDKSGVVNGKGEELLPAVYDEADIVYDNGGAYVVATKGKKKVAFPANEEGLKPARLTEFDFIAVGKGYVRKAEQFEVYDLNSGSLETTIALDALVLNGNQYNIIMRDSKFGAADFAGNIIVPCIYDFASFMDFRDEVMIGYQDGVKYYIYVENNERFTEEQW